MQLSDEERSAVESTLETYLEFPATSTMPRAVEPLARQLGALPLYVDIGGATLLKPDGTVLEVHANQNWEGAVEARQLTDRTDLVLARVAAWKAWPSLESLRPERPADAADCPTCKGAGQLFVGDLEAFCRDCGGTGWR